MDVPASLRTWFIAHFAVDVAVGLPLLIAPTHVLGLLHWSPIDPVASRLVGAALLAIGVASLGTHRHGAAAYRAMLRLKVVWSLAAIFSLFAGIAQGAPPAAWAFLAIFIAFSGIWMSYAVRLRQIANAPADLDEPSGEDAGDGGDAGGG